MPKVNFRKSDVTRAAKALRDAEVAISHVEITHEGSVIFHMFGAEQPVDEINTWDKP